MKDFVKERNHAIIGLVGNVIFILYNFWAEFSVFERVNFSSILYSLDWIILAIYFISILLNIKKIKIFQYMLIASFLLDLIFQVSGTYFAFMTEWLNIVLYISYVLLIGYFLSTFEIVNIKLDNNKFFIVCILINIFPILVSSFLGGKSIILLIIYIGSRISIIPFFCNYEK